MGAWFKRTARASLSALACGIAVAASPPSAAGAALILNEYNAVDSDSFLNGGSQESDEDGGQASDVYFGRVLGNGGDWFELVVIADGLDVRGFTLSICADGVCDEELVFSSHLLWSDLRAGTIITVAEDEPDDVSYDPDHGDWWIQVQADSAGDGTYITPNNFPVNNDEWQLTIYDAEGAPVFGPAGEGVSPSSGVNSREIFRLEEDPSALIEADSLSYDDGTRSTFGHPNLFGDTAQDFSALRSERPVADQDRDGISDCQDNCGLVHNPLQRDSNSDGFGNACDPDWNDDGIVGLPDFNLLRSASGLSAGDPDFDPVFDSDGDGRVGWAEVALLVAYYRQPPGPGPVAEECSAPDLTEWAFDPDHLLEVEIELDPEDWDALRKTGRSLLETMGSYCQLRPPVSPFEFFKGDITVDGVTLHDVGIRKKGFFGSIDSLKPSLKVKFSEYVDGQRLFGLERMTFNNSKQDQSFVEQCSGYQLFRDAGLPVPRCNFAHVVVNGEDLGIYVHVESIKDPFLVANFGSAEGNLYEGTTADFRENFIGVFEPKNGGDGSDLQAVYDALLLEDPEELLAAVTALVDYDKFLTFWAMEGLVGHWDGYTGNVNNFWVYANPTTGRFEFIPWSMDDIFGRANPLAGGGPIAEVVNVGSQLSARLYAIEGIPEQLQARLEELFATVWDVDEILSRIDRMQAVIEPVTGDLTAELAPARQWIRDRRSHYEAEFARDIGGQIVLMPPEKDLNLVPKYCLAPAGSFHAEFSTEWGSMQLPQLQWPFTGQASVDIQTPWPPFSPALVGAVAGESSVSMTGWPTIDLVVVNDDLSVYAFNLDIDPMFFQVGDDIALPDSIASQIVSVSVTGSSTSYSWIGLLAEMTASFSEVDTSDGGTIAGVVDATWAAFVPPPEPPPPGGSGAGGGCGLGFESVLLAAPLLWLRARRRSASGRSSSRGGDPCEC